MNILANVLNIHISSNLSKIDNITMLNKNILKNDYLNGNISANSTSNWNISSNVSTNLS